MLALATRRRANASEEIAVINNNQRRPFELNVATAIHTRREINAETSLKAALNTHGVKRKRRRFEPPNPAFQLGEISEQKPREPAKLSASSQLAEPRSENRSLPCYGTAMASAHL
jgi:hypothetical protein